MRFKGKALSKALTPAELIELLETSDIDSTFDSENVITDEQLEKLLDRSDMLKMMEKKSKDLKDDDNKDEDTNEDDDHVESPVENKLFEVVETCISDELVL